VIQSPRAPRVEPTHMSTPKVSSPVLPRIPEPAAEVAEAADVSSWIVALPNTDYDSQVGPTPKPLNQPQIRPIPVSPFPPAHGQQSVRNHHGRLTTNSTPSDICLYAQ
jgi:hypothetical protein